MSTETRFECRIDGKKVPYGSQVCDATTCMTCKDGHWEERFIDLVFGVGP